MSAEGATQRGGVYAPGLPEGLIRQRAREGVAAVFPPVDTYGRQLHGAGDEESPGPASVSDDLDQARLVPPVFMPRRLEKLIDLGREPLHDDVDLDTVIGGFRSPLPVYVSAFGSTRVASGDAGIAASRQAGRLGIPMVIGENMVPVGGYRRAEAAQSPILARLRAYAQECPPGVGGVVVQQSTEDADSEVWNLVYSDTSVRELRDSGRLGFELKTGQGAKPGLGGMTAVDAEEAARLAGQFAVRDVLGPDRWLRCATPGTFTEEILRQQVRFMRNNFPRARVWVKFHPGRDVAQAATTAWQAGSDAVTVDGAQGGTGWAPRAFLDQVGLPLGECLRRIGHPQGCLLATGRIWEGGRAVRALALGATAVGLGRAALLAVDEDPENGLIRLVEALALEARLLVSAVGKYRADALTAEDLWWPTAAPTAAWPARTAPIGSAA
ncbi:MULTISPECIES: glutamate synthase-related protein [Micromonospora]|uniref:Glutamate synthase n=1 Tax=Micromonospora maris TaxID=1003110 RepID=A0A9X0LCQ8_9ACTN|nr:MULTISPECIES: glutamate synthase-related protein [Micromonospora]AEB46084.1 ferredoxin-dependent glutamate synthase [Micromonospora maris AB-18-032]KUJ45369.1 glutamate synthase [Micromonospora maris]RUL94573.1 glutamate synthase [Verrucosispora sp. FIM060022]